MVGSDLPPSHSERRGKGMSVFKDEDEDDDDMGGMMCSQQLVPCPVGSTVMGKLKTTAL